MGKKQSTHAPSITRHSAVAELWRRGEVESLLFHAGQMRINAMYEALPGALLVFNISRQWGKTFFGVLKAVTAAIKQPGCRIRIGAALESDLTEFIEPAFETALATCPESLRPKYIAHKKRYVFPNGPNPRKPFIGGSTIKCVGLDKKPNGLRGNTIDLIIIDEAGFITRLNYLYDSVIVPLTTHRPNARIVLFSTPPESPAHEFWDFVARAKLEGSYAEFTIDENPLLTPPDVERLEKKLGGRHTTAFQREYLCKRIVEAEKAIVAEFSVAKHVREFSPADDPLYQFWHKYEGLDIGVQVDKTVNLFGYYNFREQRLYVMDEIDLSGSFTTTEHIERGIVEKEKQWEWGNAQDFGVKYAVYRRIADNSHPLLLNDLSSRPAGLCFVATDKDRLHEMVGEVKVWLSANRVTIHPRCKQLIGCCEGGIWNKARDKFDTSKLFGHYDALAALVYLIRNIDQWTNPIPEYVWNPDGWPVKKEVALTPLGKGIASLFGPIKTR